MPVFDFPDFFSAFGVTQYGGMPCFGAFRKIPVFPFADLRTWALKGGVYRIDFGCLFTDRDEEPFDLTG